MQNAERRTQNVERGGCFFYFYILHSAFCIHLLTAMLNFRNVKSPAPVSAICARCNGSGWVPIEGDTLRVEPCGCQGDLRRRQRITAAAIPPRYFPHCRLVDFHDRNSPALVSAKRAVQEFTDAWMPAINNGRGLLLIGA